MESLKVDLVFTWVNGADDEYVKVVRQYAKNPSDVNPERYRDAYQMLKYSLRSVERYLPWYHHIYIVTARPQVPDWLDLSNPHITLIHHDQIIDEKYLPTFNPNCIESYLHRIPGLADHFLYINDDFLFGSETLLADFMPNGKYRIFNTFAGENLPWRIYDGKNDIIGLGLIEHTPLFINKKYWQQMTELFPKKMHETRTNKFRQRADLMTYKMYRYHMLKNHKNESKAIALWDLLKINSFHKITNNITRQRRAIERLERKKPKFYCLNDDQRENPNGDVVLLIKEFLTRNFPEKSVFEK